MSALERRSPAPSGGSRALEARDPGVGREERIYALRHSERQNELRRLVWEVLCRDFFQCWIGPGDTVVDLGAGDGLFLRNVRARRRIAVDIDRRVESLASEGIEVHVAPATRFASLLGAPADVIFVSNLLEHLPDRRTVLDVLEECRRALTPGGLLLLLQPNIRHVGHAYWDYIDHQVALTDRSLVEALEVTGFTVARLISRFLPYTAASSGLGRRLGPEWVRRLLRIYLRCPPLQLLFGRQTFVAARAI